MEEAKSMKGRERQIKKDNREIQIETEAEKENVIKRGQRGMYKEGNERLPLIVARGLVGQTDHYSDLTDR